MLLVRPSGFEPETCGLRVRCSAVELEARNDSSKRVRGGVRLLALHRLGLEELFETPLAALAAVAGLLVAAEWS